ncbi:MAG: DUF302 domain-containing protein [Gammaproteobacteria bacterium]|nr:DUF302 domain-containing protein [Gammaproteobacteria bacterium]
MNTKSLIKLWMALALSLTSLPGIAQNILTVRSVQDFEHSMTSLQSSIETHGYKVAHVQRCDSGLTGLGYETDRYRVVFFGKHEEVRRLSADFPELIPFLPLKIAVFAEGEQTIISSINPTSLGEFYADDRLRIQFKRWENDLRSILTDMQQGDTTAAAAGEE